MMVTYYLLPVTGELEETSSEPLYLTAPCPTCGAHLQEQVRDLELRWQPEISEPLPVATAISGEFVVRADVADALWSAGAEFAIRDARVLGAAPGEWKQILPAGRLPLTAQSMRAPYIPCSTCGGLARVTFGHLELAVDESGPNPALATIQGAAKLIVFSESIMQVLKTYVPDYGAVCVADCGTSARIEEGSWSDL